MKLLPILLFSIFIPVSLFSADILELVKVLDANDTAKFKSMIVSAEDADSARSDNNKSVLMYASWIGNSEAAEYLVSKGADVNAEDSMGVTALHLALWKSYNAIAAFLLEHGASANIMSHEGMTPLDIAIMKNNQEMIEKIQKSAPKLRPLL